ncbi:lipase family protein [Sandaracinobacter sp. RS1-74]|uniref:lipase family protein n=1 Tax=Sandaracinobacteroides sayramensis TaxID=2913411 RepID=UPI001EDBDF9F|nr:lipase family protein [Sandaracinobacteroides sayramensis]
MNDDVARPWWRRKRHAIISLLLILAALLLMGWWATLPDTPGSFYDPPDQVPAEPGRIVRIEPVTQGIPAKARAWRFLYTTTRWDGAPAVASALLLVSETGSAPRPLVAWAHGTTGIARGCAPSLMADPFAGTPAVPGLLENGWALVATDYVGMGTPGNHAYFVGEDAARSVLDSIRAAAGHPDWRLSGEAVVWGHSQGGHSALWAGIKAPTYAPDVKLNGVVAMAPASDLPALARESGASGFGKLIFSFVYHAYAQVYPDVEAMPVKRWARMAIKDITRRCIVDRKALWTIAELWLLRKQTLLPRDSGNEALEGRLQENSPFAMIHAPLLLVQGEKDESISSKVQRTYIQDRCKAGQALRYIEYAAVDHMGLVAASSPLTVDLLDWTSARLSSPSSRRSRNDVVVDDGARHIAQIKTVIDC